MMRFLAICLGGAVGTGLRYLVTLASAGVLGSFPLGTLIVNVSGSFLLGAITHLALRGVISSDVRLVLGTGMMGGLTTYSTFNTETIQYLEDGAWLLAGTNVGLTFVSCLVGGFAGFAAARWWTGS